MLNVKRDREKRAGTGKQSKRLRVMSLVCAAALLLSGCRGPAPEAAQRTVTDCAGREVQIPQSPRNIAALDSFCGETLIMAGAGDRLAAVPDGVRQDVLLQELYPDLSRVPAVMKDGHVSEQGGLPEKPDLVLVRNSACADEVLAELERLSIPGVLIGYHSMEGQIDALTLLGQILGGDSQERIGNMTDYYRNVIRRAREIAAGIPADQRLTVYHAVREVARTDGGRSLGRDWIECVGAVNVACQGDNTGTGDYTARPEQIVQWDPDVFICSEAATAASLYTESRWTGLQAVREKQVYNIPLGVTCWGQRGSLETFFAILWLGGIIYPEHYGHIDLKQEVFRFYEEILGCSLDERIWAQMCSGYGLRATRRI